MKSYPLLIDEMASATEEPLGFYTKGTHPAEVFRAAIIAYIRETNGGPDKDYEDEVAKGTVEWTWWRSVHIGTKNSDCWRFVVGQPGTQGCYPVTKMVVDI